MIRNNPIPLLAVGVCAFLGLRADAGLVFTIENPGVQQTTVPGAITENFDDFDITSSPVGVYTGGAIVNADVFGGANGSPYYIQLFQGAATLTFAGPQTYFGVWWSAGDAGNILEFYDPSSALIASYNVGSIIPSLSPEYYGNPNSGGNEVEPYVYLNFTTTGATRLGSVIFRNTLGTGFETDNHSIFDQPIDPPGNPLPEGGATLILLGGGAGLLSILRRR